jgi:hypothetical protein
LAAPAIDEPHVGSRSDAQLGGTFAHASVRSCAVVKCQGQARVPGQQVSSPASDVGKFSERGGLALRSRWAASGIPAAYVSDLGQRPLICLAGLHLATIEHEFDLSGDDAAR